MSAAAAKILASEPGSKVSVNALGRMVPSARRDATARISPDHRARKLGRRIEAPQHGLEMHAAHAAQRLHVERGKGTREPGVAAAQPAIYIARRDPELAGDRSGIAGRIAQLVRCDADMIRLLGERQTQ